MNRLLLLLGILTGIACTKMTVEEPLPEISGIETFPSQLPKINVRADSAEFDKMFENFLEDIEIEASVDFYDENGLKKFTGAVAEIEIKGTSSAKYILKSLGIEFEPKISNADFQIITPKKVLEGDHLENFTEIRLRNSGNDFGKTMLKDLAYTHLAIYSDLDLELMYGRPVQVFVNGQYYGLMNLRTGKGEKAIADLLSKNKKHITTFEVDRKNQNLEFEDGDKVFGDRVETAIEKEDAAEIAALVDIDNFIDYLIFQDYIGNDDWPENNVLAYSVQGTPLRFFLFDLDFSAYRSRTKLLPALEYRSDDLAKIFRALKENDATFFPKLKERQRELYKILRPQIFNQIVDELALPIEDEILYLISKYHQPASTFHWKRELDLLKREFDLRDRFVRDEYDLKD